MADDPQGFRELFGSFPTFVSIVTTLDENDEPRGLTCNAVCAVSMEPTLLLICVDKRSQTLPALLRRGAFVVNVLAEGGESASERFAGKSGTKFDALDWRPSARHGGLPVLADIALAWAECAVVQRMESGDHWVLVARVEETAVLRRRPLLYFRGQYLPWAHTADRPAAASLAAVRT